MNLVDGNGQDLNSNKKLVDVSGEEITSQPPTPMTTADVGRQLANHMLNGAQKFPNNELVNKQFDVLYFAALNILAHRILNVGLGFGEEGNVIAEWNVSRAFAQEKQTQEDLSLAVEDWKNQYFNGELAYRPSKT